MADKESTPLLQSTRMPFIRRYTYGVGHVLNDLTASMWFSYLVVYFHRVLEFDNVSAGYIILIGQISDAICTPLIGYESDVATGFLCRYGKRKIWHLVGTICVVCSFIFVFQPCFGCTEDTALYAKFIYYAPILVIFQFGWAAVQINHLALIPELTKDVNERVGLNAIRYTFTVLSSIFVYVLMWLLFALLQSNGHDEDQVNNLSTSLGPIDIPQFRLAAFIVVAVGGLFSFIFHVGTKEKSTIRVRTENGTTSITSGTLERSADHVNMTWLSWLKNPQFYQVAGIYMCTRLVVNVSQVYIPLYVTDTLLLPKDAVAIIPLVVYVSGFVASSLFAKPINKYFGRKMTYFFAIVLVLAACIWIMSSNVHGKQIYGIAILLGSGGSMALVTSLSMTADLISRNTESGAFVYGAMSFTDKLSNGAAIMIIQAIHPCKSGCCAACRSFYQKVLVYVPGGAALLALLVLATLIRSNIGERRRAANTSIQQTDQASGSS